MRADVAPQHPAFRHLRVHPTGHFHVATHTGVRPLRRARCSRITHGCTLECRLTLQKFCAWREECRLRGQKLGITRIRAANRRRKRGLRKRDVFLARALPFFPSSSSRGKFVLRIERIGPVTGEDVGGRGVESRAIAMLDDASFSGHSSLCVIGNLKRGSAVGSMQRNCGVPCATSKLN